MAEVVLIRFLSGSSNFLPLKWIFVLESRYKWLVLDGFNRLGPMGQFKLIPNLGSNWIRDPNNFIILIRTQLFELLFINFNKTGLSGKYCFGFFRASSQITLTAAAWTPGSLSSSFSRRRGRAIRSAINKIEIIVLRWSYIIAFGIMKK